MKRTLVSVAALLLLTASFAAGHFLWPVPVNAKADKRHNRYACPTPASEGQHTADGKPLDPAHPEAGAKPPLTLEEIKAACRTAIEHPEDRELLGNLYLTAEQLGDGMHAPLLAFLATLPVNLTTNHEVQEVILVRWTELDPAAAARFALKTQPAGFQREMLQRVMATWANDDPSSAKAFLITIQDEQLRSFLTQYILTELTQENPQEALQLALALPPGMVSNAVSQVFSSWASDDARGALDAAVKLAPGATKQSVLGSVLADWAREEPEAAMAWLTHEDRGLGMYQFQVFVTVASDHPEIAARHVDAIGLSNERGEIFSSIARNWFEHDPKAAMSWVKKLDPQDQRRALGGAIDAQVGSDPAAAVELARLIDSPSERNEQLGQTYARWSREDPAGALESARGLRDASERENAITQVIGGLSSIDPSRAAGLVSDITGEAHRNEAIAMVASSWAQIDAGAAGRWVETLPHDETRANAMRTVVQNWSQSDAAGAVRFAEATGDTTVVSAAVSAWASNDPIAAADWVNERQAPDDYVINSIANAWFSRDERGAADWAMGLRDPKQRDTALSSVAQMNAYRDPAAAIDLALSMTASEERSAELRSLYVTWESQDSAAAKRWLGDTRLPEDARRALTTDQVTETAREGCVCP